MSFNSSRYINAARIDGGRGIATVRTSSKIRSRILSGQLRYTTMVAAEGQRLDTLAGSIYGNSSLWWIIAAASGVGWGLQVPPGTVLSIPTNPGRVIGLV
jgi:hypothetical protein